MEKLYNSIAIFFATLVLLCAWSIFKWVWIKPKRLEKYLRKQGFQGNSYRFLFGDMKEWSFSMKEAISKSIDLSDDIVPRVFPPLDQCVKTHGKNSFFWMGPSPRVNIMDSKLVNEILTKSSVFPKQDAGQVSILLAGGLVRYNGEKWAKHRKIINPAFHVEKLKLLVPAFYVSSLEMVSKWEKMVFLNGSCELDVWPYLETLSADVISRTAFGSNYAEGRRIFELQKEQAALVMETVSSHHIPGWRFLPTKKTLRMRKIFKEVRGLLWEIVSKRTKTIEAGLEACNNDLLGILLKSNMIEVKERGNDKKLGMSIEDVIEECKLFYFAGQETTSVLLVWTMILLSKHQHWQQLARDEVLKIFGDQNPDFDRLSHLKTVPMILLEVLRLYPPLIALTRTILQDVKLGQFNLPSGMLILLPIIVIHRDKEIWGDDANEFNPERFSDGISNATKNQVSFLPFGWGTRVCVGQNFAMLEAKMAISMILQRFRFELSSSYVHAPFTNITLQPQHGAPLILHKL